MNTTLERIELSTTADEDDDTCHLVCEVNENWSLCGRDVSEEDWVPDDDPVEDCPCCEEFDRADFCAHCAMGES